MRRTNRPFVWGEVRVGLIWVMAFALLGLLGPGACSRNEGAEGKAPQEEEPAPVEKRVLEEASGDPPPAAEQQETEEETKWSPPRFTERQDERDAMVAAIDRHGLRDKAVLEAMSVVPRHEFVPDKVISRAYGDHPLNIGYGQTISQPYIVAEMTHQLKLTPDSRVLEVGTGSGYQAAVLTEFTRHVYSIEIVKPLADAVEKRLKRLGYDVVATRQGDGYYGWPEEASFDGIIVTCAAGQIPPPLLKQLAPGGRMVIPVGRAYARQTLMLVEKDTEGRTKSRSLMGVTFVPLTRKDPSAEEE